MTTTQNEVSPQCLESPTQLAAGGLDPSHFDWAEAWYPIYYYSGGQIEAIE